MHRRPDDLLMDALIAATAAVHNLVVVTRNVRDFRRLGSPTSIPGGADQGRCPAGLDADRESPP
jgi:hypothetical protein